MVKALRFLVKQVEEQVDSALKPELEVLERKIKFFEASSKQNDRMAKEFALKLSQVKPSKQPAIGVEGYV